MRSLSVLALVLMVTLCTHSVCDVIFDCGCRPPGLGGVEHCNIQEAHTPNCPWCAGGPLAQGLSGVILLLGTALGAVLGYRRTKRAGGLLGAGVVGYLLAALIAGLLAALITGYPTWMGITL